MTETLWLPVWAGGGFIKFDVICAAGLNASPLLLTSKDVRSALLVLLQHSCVFARVPVTVGTERPKPPVYRVDLHSVLFKMR